ncbi:MAG: hypothetical protein RR397_10980 [Odoribacter sp.]
MKKTLTLSKKEFDETTELVSALSFILQGHQFSLEEKRERSGNIPIDQLTDYGKELLSDDVVVMDVDLFPAIGVLNILKEKIDLLNSALNR